MANPLQLPKYLKPGMTAEPGTRPYADRIHWLFKQETKRASGLARDYDGIWKWRGITMGEWFHRAHDEEAQHLAAQISGIDP